MRMQRHLLDHSSGARTVTSRALFVSLATIFVFTHLWILLSFEALYWDDWTLLNSSDSYIRQMFQFTGFDLLGSFHVWFSPFGVGAYKILTLVSLALMSYFAFLILRNYSFSALQAGCVTAFFIVAPLNTAKIAAINVPGTLFATIFFLAWVLLLRDLLKPSLLQRLCVLALFSVAFYFPSSLAFFALPAMSIAWYAFRSNDRWTQRLSMFFRRIDFLVLPFIQFAIFRFFFFKPHASIAAEYQAFGLRTSRLQEAVDRIQADFLIDMPWVIRIILVALPILFLLRFFKRPTDHSGQTIRIVDVTVVIGFSACFFALLPYVAVGRLPIFSDWNSRYHLFLPLGFALICWCICQYVAGYADQKWFGISTFAVMLSLSAAFSVSSYFEYASDWRKQQQLMAAMQKLSFVNPSDNIIFDDSVTYAKRRQLRYNEYTQMMMLAHPDWHGIALSGSQLKIVGSGSLKSYMQSMDKLENIQLKPQNAGLSSQWRWNDSCLVLQVFELDGFVQVKQLKSQSGLVQPCLHIN